MQLRFPGVVLYARGCRNGAMDYCRDHKVGDKVEAALVDLVLAKIFEALLPFLPHGLIAFIAGSLLAGLGQQ